jgi:hypothetical protein
VSVVANSVDVVVGLLLLVIGAVCYLLLPQAIHGPLTTLPASAAPSNEPDVSASLARSAGEVLAVEESRSGQSGRHSRSARPGTRELTRQ